MKWQDWGPGFVVTAAFVGPGTVTVCSLAGAQYGLSLLWVLLWSVIATVILQEMAAHLGIARRQGLAASIRLSSLPGPSKIALLVLIITAICIGNAAYEAGNIGGAVLGLEGIAHALSPIDVPRSILALFVGIIAVALLWHGSYSKIERLIMGIVALMGAAFAVTALYVHPPISQLFYHLLVPTIPEGSLPIVLSLVGTTVVPYNLYLHSRLAAHKWSGERALLRARKDTYFAITIGGIISASILIAASALQGQPIESAADLSLSLGPLLGAQASFWFGIGLFAAGLSSATTAPLAAAIVVGEAFGWEEEPLLGRGRWIWTTLILIGMAAFLTRTRPIAIIQMAQFANGLLLPLSAALLWWMLAYTLRQQQKNMRWRQHLMAGGIVLFTALLGIKSLVQLLNT